MKPIIDGGEISIDFPDKTYMGSFGRHSEFMVNALAEGIVVKLHHGGEDRRTAEIHLHYFFLADLLAETAKAIAQEGAMLDEAHREPLLDAANQLKAAFARRRARKQRK